MSETCATVKIKSTNGSGFVVINESDFDAEKHNLFGVDSTETKTAAKAETKAEKKAREKAEAEAQAAGKSSAPWK